jgi:hypothetical protein
MLHDLILSFLVTGQFLVLETNNKKTCCNWMVLFEESIKVMQKRMWKYDYSFWNTMLYSTHILIFETLNFS